MALLLIVGVLIFHALLYYLYKEYVILRHKYPPGPIPLPFFGNILQIDMAYPHRTMIKWKKKYGPVFTVWLPNPTIVLADYNVFREALITQGNIFSGRPMSFLFGMFYTDQPDGDGIVGSQNERWSTQRRFALHVFRDFGMGRNLMECKIQHYAHALVQHLREEIADGKTQSAITNIHDPITFCVGNIIHNLVAGKEFSYRDPVFSHFKKIVEILTREVISASMLLVDRYPFIRFLVPAYYHLYKDWPAVADFLVNDIDEREKTFLAVGSEDEDPKDYIDAYLKYMHKNPNHEHFSKTTLAMNALDLWTAGLETTVTTLRWAIIYLIHHPDVQKRVHDEIDKNLGTRMVQWADRTSMHYTMAVLCEVQRIINILPWHVWHATTSDTILSGYNIQKGTTIMPLLGAINFDEDLYPDSESFQPSRFLNSDGTLRNVEYLIPFGIGERSCLGESLARMELFIIFTTLLQNFEFSAAYGVPPSLERFPGGTTAPQDYECEIRLRDNVA